MATAHDRYQFTAQYPGPTIVRTEGCELITSTGQRIIDGDREGLVDDLESARSNGIAPLDIINEILLDGMREVGELFGSGQMQLPFVLQSAETMKMAVSHLEPHMDKVAGSSSGRASNRKWHRAGNRR